MRVKKLELFSCAPNVVQTRSKQECEIQLADAKSLCRDSRERFNGPFAAYLLLQELA